MENHAIIQLDIWLFLTLIKLIDNKIELRISVSSSHLHKFDLNIDQTELV